MSVIFYLKKEKDVTQYGHGSDEHCFILDEAQDINIGHPARKLQKIKKMGDGVIIKDFNQFEEADFKTQTHFGADNTDTFFSQERDDFLMNWVYTNDKVYLYKNDGINFGRMRVYPAGKGKEKIKNFVYVDYDVNFECESSFFESITETVLEYSKNTENFLCQIQNDGASVPFIFEIIISDSIDGIFIKLYENIGIMIADFLTISSKISINTGNMSITVNDVERELNVSGSPFKLESGSNNLNVICSADGEIEIKYYKRFV